MSSGRTHGFRRPRRPQRLLAGTGAGQHGGSASTCLRQRSNIELVGELEMDTPDAFSTSPADPRHGATRAVTSPGQIADLAVYKNDAYLNSWSERDLPARRHLRRRHLRPGEPAPGRRSCPRSPNTRHGEGAHVITHQHGSGRGRAGGQQRAAAAALPAGRSRTPAASTSGTSRTRPTPALKLSVGDTGPDDGTLDGDPARCTSRTARSCGRTTGTARSSRSRDNIEFHDLDIFEITDPANPRPVAEFDLVDRFPQVVSTTAPRRLDLQPRHGRARRSTASGRCCSTTGTPATSRSTSPTRPTRSTSATPASTASIR